MTIKMHASRKPDDFKYYVQNPSMHQSFIVCKAQQYTNMIDMVTTWVRSKIVWVVRCCQEIGCFILGNRFHATKQHVVQHVHVGFQMESINLTNVNPLYGWFIPNQPTFQHSLNIWSQVDPNQRCNAKQGINIFNFQPLNLVIPSTSPRIVSHPTMTRWCTT